MSDYHANAQFSPLLESLDGEVVHRYLLDNGLTVIHREDHSSQLASVQAWVKTGSIHEAEKLGAGLSHYLEHLLFKGTKRRGPLDISREVHATGGSINAYTTFDRTVYYIDAPSSAAPKVFDLLGDMVFHAMLPEDEIRCERDVILREIDMGLDDPDRRLFSHFAHTAFREHPYRYPVIGHRPLFEGVTPNELRHYYRGRYAPNNVVLVVVGAITEAHCRALAEEHFGAAPMQQLTPALFDDEPAQLAPREHRAVGDFTIVRGMMGFKVPGLASPDAPALDVLARLLGQGASSWLNQSLREKQRLVHEISAGCWNPGSHGLLWINYICDPGKREVVEDAIRAELERIRDNLPADAEVAKAVRQSVVAEVNTRKTVSGQAARLGAAEVCAGDLGYPRQHLARLAKMTGPAIEAAAARFLVGPGETAVSLEPSLKPIIVPAINTGSGLPDFEEITFPNGARLLLQPGGALPKTHLRFASLGGPLYDPANRRGATGVLATILTRDTKKRSQAEVAEAIESVGGSFQEFVGNNTFGLSLETLVDDFPLAAELLGDALQCPAFTQKTFDIERDAQRAALQEDDDEVLEWSRRQLRATYFGDHPYAVDYLGDELGLNALTANDIRALATRLIVGPNAVLAVSGQFDRDRAIDRLGPALSTLPAAFNAQECPLIEAPSQPGDFTLHRDREQAIVLVAFPDCGTRQPDEFLAGEALDELFSGMSSQLFQRVREERGMAYFVGSQRTPGLDCGLFHFYAGTSAAQASDVRAEILAEIDRARAGGFTTEEWSSSQTRLIVRRQQSQQAPGSRAMHACLQALYGQPINSARDYPDRVRALTVDALQSFARERFTDEKRLTQITLPA